MAKKLKKIKKSKKRKTRRIRVAGAASRTISAQTIMTRLRNVLGRDTVNWDAPATDYIRGGPAAVQAFFGPLNRSAQFSPDGLDLQPSDLMNVNTIADVGAAIIAWYTSNGWQVII